MIGSALVEQLLDAGHDVHGIDLRPNRWSNRVDNVTKECNLLEGNELSHLPKDIEIVVHLAANARVHRLVQNPRKARDNFEMTYNLLEYIRESDINGVIFGSSREVYGNGKNIVYTETDTHIDECESPYTASKVGGEALLKSYHQCYDIDVSILRFSNVYGRYDISDRVIPLFIAQAADNQNLTVYGEQKVLDFTHLDDCVNGIDQVIDQFNKAKGETFNIASGTGSSLVEVAEKISERLSDDPSITVENNRTGEVARYIADITKAEKVLGYEPAYMLSDGLETAIDWYMKNDQYFDDILDR